MPDITTVAAFITSVRNATDIAKALRDVNVSLEKAEAKLKVAELISSLADAKIQATEIQDALQERDKRISELEKALELKAKLIRQGDGYYEVDQSGKLLGDPYCSHCWEISHKPVHLLHQLSQRSATCPACKNLYDSRRVLRLGETSELETSS